MLIEDICCLRIIFLIVIQFVVVISSKDETETPGLSVEPRKDIPTGSNIKIQCLGYSTLMWKFEQNSGAIEISENEINKAFPNIRITPSYQPENSINLQESYLEILNASFNNTGTYKCMYYHNSKYYDIAASTYIFVNDPNKLLLTDFITSHRKILYRNSTVPCLPTISSLDVTLWKGNAQVPTATYDVRFDPTVGFIFKNPIPYFNGLFTCKTEYNNNTVEVYFNLITEKYKFKRPVINVTSMLNVKVGSTLKLNCSGEFFLEWITPNRSDLFGDVLKNVIHRDYIDGKEKYIAELEISNIQYFHTGLYRCCYQHPYCLSEEDEVQVYVFVNDPKNLFIKPNNHELQTQYRCIRDAIFCLPTFSYLNVTLWMGKNFIPIDDNNTSYDPTHGFILHKLQTVPYIYSCKAEYEHKTKEINIPSVTLDKKADIGLYIYATNNNPFEGSEVEIVCEACRYNYNNIIWTWTESNGEREIHLETQNDLDIIISYQTTVTSLKQRLKFKSIKSNNDGVYKCIGVINSGNLEFVNKSKSVQIETIALEKPFFTKTNINSSKLSLQLGKRHEFFCFAEGIPLPNISWYKDDQLIIEDYPGVVFQKRSQILTIDPIIEDDSGVYICTAKNRIGSINKTVTIEIQTENYYGEFKKEIKLQTNQLTSSEIFLIVLFTILLIIFLSSILFLIKNMRGIQILRLTGEEEEICIPEIFETDSEIDDKL